MPTSGISPSGHTVQIPVVVSASSIEQGMQWVLLVAASEISPSGHFVQMPGVVSASSIEQASLSP